MSQTRNAPRMIVFNGPPHSGKDTATDAVVREFAPDAVHVKVSQPLKDAVRALMQLTDTEAAHLEAHKEERDPLLLGRTYREFQIMVSEEWMKPVFGAHVFGNILARRMARYLKRQTKHYGPQTANGTVFVCSDGGFEAELIPPAALVGRKRMLIIQLEREGCSFQRDSRGYVTLEEVQTIRIKNEGDRAAFCRRVVDIVREWLTAGP